MSFSEMMSSARGPGVIGMLMALAVLAIFVLLFVFAFDESFQGGAQSIESVISQQAQDLDHYQSGITDGQKALARQPDLVTKAKEFARLKRENESVQGRLAALGNDIESGKTELARINEAFETYKDQYRAFVRGKARGESIETLETQTGVIYKNVNIREVTAVGIQIRHDEGQKRIPYEELPQAMIDHFQFDPQQKAAALAEEQKAWTEHETAVSKSEKQAGVQKKKNVEELKEKSAQLLAIKEAQLLALGKEVSSMEFAIMREEQKGISRAPEMRVKLAKKQNELSALRVEVARMRATP